ncbi:MAG: hypothetical protein AAF771_03045 [Pseudomonadota bacterium]
MSYPMEDQAPADMMAPPPVANVGEARPFRIARNGGRPLRFSGAELGMAMSYTPEIPYWYEINLYRTSSGAFVLAIRLFHISDQKTDTVEAWEFDSLEDALWKIESYDPGADVDVALKQDLDRMTPADLAAEMLELKARIAGIRHHYRSLAGEFLGTLDAA